MLTRANIARRRRTRRNGRTGAKGRFARRRATVLVFVMAILGVLFVTGITFMATMNFEAGIIAAEKDRELIRPSVQSVMGDFGDVLEDVLPTDPGAFLADKAFSEFGMQFAELPGVHNTFSPIEPYQNAAFEVVFPWFTDPVALANGPFAESDRLYRYAPINTAWTSGVDPGNAYAANFPDVEPVPVDADGDGIVDSLQVKLSLLGVNKAARSKLSSAVNPVSRPNGEVYLGLRVIPHGGMVDVNHAHPLLIQNALGFDPTNDANGNGLDDNLDGIHKPPYTPLSEEGSLRRRFMLAPRVLSPSKLQGNPVSDNPLSGGGHYAERLFAQDVGEDLWNHRYWPYAPDEMNDSIDPQRPIWAVRMDPTFASTIPALSHYDRRHLITTVSHDNLLRRDTISAIIDPTVTDPNFSNIAPRDANGDGVLDYGVLDVFERMVEVNKRYYVNAGTCQPDPLIYGQVPFEYVNYPQDIPNQWNIAPDPANPGRDLDWCACIADPDHCTVDPRKGRLRVSLPWLEEAFTSTPPKITELQLISTIRDSFTLMLLNARGNDWGNFLPVGVDGGQCCLPDGSCSVTGPLECTGAFTPDLDALRDDAAWKFTDFDKVAETAASLTANLIDFMDANDIPTQVEIRQADYTNLTTFGQSYTPRRFVYGLERQPFISEIAAQMSDPSADPPIPTDAYAIELFNPYEGSTGYFDDITTTTNPVSRYYLRAGTNTRVPLDEPILRDFTVFKEDPGNIFLSTFNSVTPPDTLAFRSGDTIFLTRELWYPPNPEAPLVTLPVEIVVDEFKVSGDIGTGATPGALRSIQRPGVWDQDQYPFGQKRSPWLAPIPTTLPPVNGHTLGADNDGNADDDGRLPTEVLFANTGSMTTAFPTTGSLLLLMRRANMDMDTFSYSENRAFTTTLNNDRDTNGDMMPDTGRMPVFDFDDVVPPTPPMSHHHMDPNLDPTSTKLPLPTDPLPAGGMMHLPWGQLVFDYFTALPRSNPGPSYEPPGPTVPTTAELVRLNQPRVDLDGLRVHGRININAAPWKVLAGLPLMPGDAFLDFPPRLRARIEDYASLVPAHATDIGNALSQGMVAYRETRSINAPNGTGEYDNERGWQTTVPKFRRGTGFMTVGELANVRHAAAAVALNPPQFTFPEYSFYRMDAGVIGSGSDDYIGAVALLVALGDWVTVRSDVLTMYGTFRGEIDKAIPGAKAQAEDVDKRALRFQETIDRLPTFMGESAPRRIGDRVIAAYNDVIND